MTASTYPGCLWVSVLCTFALSAATKLTYTIPEEKQAGYTVGNVIEDADFARRYEADGEIPPILRSATLFVKQNLL